MTCQGSYPDMRSRSVIAEVLRLTRWEWFKLRRRWMPWVLLAIAAAFAQLGLWGGYF